MIELLLFLQSNSVPTGKPERFDPERKKKDLAVQAALALAHAF